MIVVRIWGGLGNQMFQYALGYAEAQRRNMPLALDTSFYHKDNPARQTKRELELFNLPVSCRKTMEPETVSRILPVLQTPIVNFAIRKLFPSGFKIGRYVYVKEKRLEYLPKALVDGENVYFDGYWHSEKYFVHYRKEIVEQFVFDNARIDDAFKMLRKSSEDSLVAVHIRRGDYVSQNNPNICDEEYYLKAMDEMKRLLACPVFCFFSDDLDWVKEKFAKLGSAVFVNEDKALSDIEEFQLMARCDHFIISNSSFSWWAAWLSQNREKKVVVPQFWKGKKDMMLEEWIKI